MLSLLALSVDAVGAGWDSFPIESRKALPPVLHQLIFNYMIKNDCVVDCDITPLLPSLIKIQASTEHKRKAIDIEASYDEEAKSLSRSGFSPSLDLSGCKAVSETTIAQIAEVCPDLQEIILDGTTTVTDSLFASLFQKLVCLRSVRVAPAYLLTDEALASLSPSIREKLEALTLNRIQRQLSLNALRSLVDECPNMRELAFQTFIPNTQMNDELVMGIARSRMNTSLLSLTLSDCSFVTDEAVEKVIKHCKKLEVLRIGMAIKMQGTCFERFSAENCGATLRVLDFNNRTLHSRTLIHISQVCTRLQTLGLANAPEPVDYEALKRLFAGCPLLKDLSITVGADAAELECFANLPNLRYLYLVLFHAGASDDQETYFKDEAIETLAEGCPGLENLCIRGATDNSLSILAGKLPRLQSISLFITHLSNKQRVKRKEIEVKVKALKSAKSKLQSKVGKTMQLQFETQFTESETALIDLEKQLREKEKERETKAEEEGEDAGGWGLSSSSNGNHRSCSKEPSPINGMSPSSSPPKDRTSKTKKKRKRMSFVCTDLETLSLNGSNISSSTVCALLRDYHTKGEVKARGVGFSKISFTNCCKVGNSVLEAIAELFAHSVESLVFYKCGLVTDEGLAYIANCGRLTSVDVRGCVLVSSKGIRKVLRKCKNLETIFLPQNSLSAEERGQLRRSFPHVRVTLSSQ